MLETRIAEAKNALLLAAEISKQFYGKKLVIAYSGGKDSDVMLALAVDVLETSDFEVINNHTSVDLPPTVKHIREVFRQLREIGIEATVSIPIGDDGKQVNMTKLIIKNKYPPTRTARYCCKVLKESRVPNRICALGVRAQESTNRKGRDLFATRGTGGGGIKTGGGRFFSVDHVEEVLRKSKDDGLYMDDALIKAAINNEDLIVNPIYNWSDREIWQYINECGIETNPLYFPPYNYIRVGCGFCPMAGYNEKKKQEADFPGYKRLYIRALDKMLEERRKSGLSNRKGWDNGEEVYNWWIQEYQHTVKGQITIDEWLNSRKG